MEPLGLTGLVKGTDERPKEVRFVKSRALEATCACADFLKTGELCKHGVGFLVALKHGLLKIEPAARVADMRMSEVTSLAPVQTTA